MISNQADIDGDDEDDIEDTDDDNDSVLDQYDDFPTDPNESVTQIQMEWEIMRTLMMMMTVGQIR